MKRLLLAVLLIGCRRHGGVVAKRPVHDPELGTLNLRAPKPAELRDDLAFLRALSHGETPAPPAHAVAAIGRRVFVTFHRPRQEPLTTTGLGPTLADALKDAAREIDASRLQLDVVQSARAFVHPSSARLGSYGVFRASAFVLPGDPLQRGWMSEEEEPALPEAKLQRLLEKGTGAPRLFTTTSAVENAAHDGALLLYRGRPKKPASIDTATLRHRIELGARYLARMTDGDGKLLYLYDLARDREVDDEYSEIRHAGATDALFGAFQELREPALRDAGNRALAWLDQRVKDLDGGRAYLPDDENPMGTIGGTGLTLIAFASHAAATGEKNHLPRMRALAEFLVGQIDSSGKFQAFGGAGRDVLYYPGEAMLGLLRLYSVDPDPQVRNRWLDAAERVAKWRIRTPYLGKRDWYRDYWFLLVLGELHRHTGDAMWSDHAASITDAGMREQDEEEADFAASGGSYDDTPRPNPTSTYFESLASSVAAARKTGRSDAALLDHARRAATFVVWQQIDEDTSYCARDPERALGGVPGNPWGTYVRIDDVQHAIRAMLALLHAQ
ncbi:MAG: hypothetical protein ACXVEE_39105 [Polyangiales bacterium]